MNTTFEATLVVAVRNQLDAVRRCLTAVSEHTHDLSFDVVVIDQGSTDGSSEFLTALGGDVSVVRWPTDRGPAAALRAAAWRAGSERLVWLDPSVEVLDGWLPPLVSALADPIVGAAVPLTRDLDGTSVPPPWAAADGPVSAVRTDDVVLALRRGTLRAISGRRLTPGPELCDALRSSGLRIAITDAVVERPIVGRAPADGQPASPAASAPSAVAALCDAAEESLAEQAEGVDHTSSDRADAFARAMATLADRLVGHPAVPAPPAPRDPAPPGVVAMADAWSAFFAALARAEREVALRNPGDGEQLRLVLERHGPDADLLAALARDALAQGDLATARTLGDRATSMDPESQAAHHFWRELHLALHRDEPPHYTSDWFSTNTPAWEMFFAGWDRTVPHTAIEIGSYEGRSAQWLLDNVLVHPGSRLHCIDVFADADQPDSYWSRFFANTARYGARVVQHRGLSFDVLRQLLTDGVRAEFVYVDGSHRASEVLEDLVLAFHLLVPGGLMICDDYLGGSGSHAETTLGSPKYAVDTFTTMYRDRVEVLTGQPLYQLAMRKLVARDGDDPASRGA